MAASGPVVVNPDGMVNPDGVVNPDGMVNPGAGLQGVEDEELYKVYVKETCPNKRFNLAMLLGAPAPELKELLEGGGNVNYFDLAGVAEGNQLHSPLLLAVENGDACSAEFLLTQGAVAMWKSFGTARAT